MLKRIIMGTVGIWLLTTSLSAQSEQLISGRVMDSQTNMPLPGANVYVLPKGPGIISDAHGRFKIKLTAAQEDSLRISFMGYRPATIALAKISGELRIKLVATTFLFSETVVTATRQPAVRAAVPAATELVEIRSPSNIGRQNAGEVLAQAQSIFVKEYGGVSGLKTINLRGAGDGQILVLADGVRLNNPQNGGVDAGLLSLVSIDKIEIVRGNASAQYGSDALGGVIHLRSLQPPAGFSGRLQTSAGSFGTFDSRVQVGYGNTKWRGIIAMDRLVSDGNFPIDHSGKIKRRNNASQRRELFVRWSASLREDLRLNLLHRASETAQSVPGSLQYPSLAAQQKDLNQLTSAMLDWNLNSLVQLSAQFSGERRDQRYQDPSFSLASHHKIASRLGTLQNRAQLHQTLDILAGCEIGNYRFNSTDLGKPERTQRSGFFQIEWKPFIDQRHSFWQLKIIPSLRYDDYSDVGHRTSPKLALGLSRQSTSRLSLHASHGQSFRVPSMNDLFWPAGPFVAGNPALKPETGRELEGGMLYEFSRAGNWQIELAGFDSQMKDLIVWTSDANFRYSPVNLANANIRGLELAAAWRGRGDRVNGRITYTRLSAKNAASGVETNGKDLTYRPRDKVDVQANCDLRYFTLSGNFQFVGRRFIDAANRTSLPAYRVTNFSLSRQIHIGDFAMLFHAEVKNVFDKHFSIIEGYPLPGRELRASLRLEI
ncbi:MAG: TonB-dependent receptor [candidate division KSB1 bacterium]|nr:TonB-dependent receptor [candidate division KSB1 bacterium]MDZ7303811.1 TonB-dependent receptor [candidate division KSB1 bacterium]MDZ7314178.1 TonB-dependent receptor [candidate division KSB1 bacterium]